LSFPLHMDARSYGIRSALPFFLFLLFFACFQLRLKESRRLSKVYRHRFHASFGLEGEAMDFFLFTSDFLERVVRSCHFPPFSPLPSELSTYVLGSALPVPPEETFFFSARSAEGWSIAFPDVLSPRNASLESVASRLFFLRGRSVHFFFPRRI